MGCLTISYHPEHYEPPLKVVRDEDEFPIECASTYSYSFQGQERDDEVKGEGNSYNYKYRMHDPRLGRFFAVDPLTAKYPHYSPYMFSGNRVIAWKELEGLEDILAINPDGSSYSSGIVIPDGATNISVYKSDQITGAVTGKSISVVKGAISSFEYKGVLYKAHFSTKTGEFCSYKDEDGNTLKSSYWAVDPNAEVKDNIGYIQHASDEEYEDAPMMAWLKDVSVDLLNSVFVVGSIDNAVAITGSDDYTIPQKLEAWLPIVVQFKGKKSTGRLAPSKIQKGDVLDLTKFTKKEKGTGNLIHEKSGYKISKDRLGDNSHGGSAWKLLDKEGKRVGTLDADGKYLRE